MKIKCLLVISTILLLSIVACKKNKITPSPLPVTPPSPINGGTRQELTKDSIYLYAKQVYLWNDALPSYETFNPRKYTSGSTDLANYNSELYALTQIKIDPNTGKPYEYVNQKTYPKYSYISDKTAKNPSAYIPALSSVDLDGNGNDLGATLGLYANSNYPTNPEYAICITAVYPNSPADKAGLVRGDRITKMNGTSIGNNYNAEINLINSFLTASTMTLEILKADATKVDITLSKAAYKTSPVLHTKIFTSGTKKIGYLVYARFSSLANSQADLDAAFANFANAGITDLIVDLRYNGGGYIITAEYLTNLIAPPSINGSVMFAEHFNSTMQKGEATILTNQPAVGVDGKILYLNGVMQTLAGSYPVSSNTIKFNKKGSLNTISNIVFLVTSSTASASELIINSLKPYVNVTLIGETTFGKPVGFFPITIENKYDVYFTMFQTKNSLGQGDYFAGFTPDYSLQEFIAPTPTVSPLRNFGDPLEIYTAKALSILAPGIIGFSNAPSSGYSKNLLSVASTQNLNSLITPLPKQLPSLTNGNEFLGMIETRHRKK